jgi:16S rRNA (uracil1498-N3)-methyltransferase
MARRRFFVPAVRRGTAELTGDDAEHLVRVLRAEVGQVYEISDNTKVYLARVTVARKSVVEFEVMEQLASEPEPMRVTLLAALIKFDKFEEMVEKATELGVSEIVPFTAARTEHGLAKAAIKRHARWERIALEASQQSRRSKLPEIRETASFADAIAAQSTLCLLLDENPAAAPILSVLPNGLTPSAALLVGPEGGWTDEERTEALAAGWTACSLGKTVLRAETASIAALAVLRAWAASKLVPPDGLILIVK